MKPLVLIVAFITSLTLPSEDSVKHNGCGPESLLAVCKLFGIPASIEELCRLSGQDETGTSMYGLWYAAKIKGLDCKGVKSDLKGLKKMIDKGGVAIALVEKNGMNHFVVVEDMTKGKVKLIDPPSPPRPVDEDEFKRIFTGYALLILGRNHKRGNTPDIYFDEINHNFGKVGQNQELLYTFKFWNKGEEPLRIKEIRSSCGCTAAVVSKGEVPPGDMGEIRALFNTGYRRGRFREEIHVISNDPEKPEVILTLSGEIVRSVVAVPDRLYFGEIKGGDQRRKRVQIIDLDGKRLNIEKVRSSSKGIRVRVNREKDNEITLEVILNPLKMKLGAFEERIVVYTNNDMRPEIEIPLSGEILGEIELKPPRLFFGMMRAGERKELKVEILKSGEADLRLISVEGAGKLVEIKGVKEVEKGRRYELRVVLHPVRRGEIEGRLKVRTNNERQPVLEIPFYGYCLNSK